MTLGNSSTAITGGALWRSLPRLALTRADGTGPLRLWQNAATNQLYVHPAHKDYGADEGDLFPANTPYLLVSHGSSGSDQPFLEAVAMILAAFRPDTKARLVEENLIVPTVQMVFRRSLQNVPSRDDYFSGAAHPAAFEGYNINLARMVSLANSIRPDEIPPAGAHPHARRGSRHRGRRLFRRGPLRAALRHPGRHRPGLALQRRPPHDDPQRRGHPRPERPPSDLPLAPAAGRSRPGPDRAPPTDGRQARITLDWHDPFRISEDNPLISSRIDIGVFANNGVHDSAPAILSWYCPPEETRSYAPGPDGAPRLVSIDYADPAAETYADPMLIARADWRDDYHYDADGTLRGWTRSRAAADDATEEFAADGARILTRGPDGRPARAEIPAYVLDRDP